MTANPRLPHWLTIPQAALALGVGTAEVRKLIRKGELVGVEIEALDTRVVTRDSVEAVRRQRDAARWSS